jgi:outer membrane biosynthesis protein TonB
MRNILASSLLLSSLFFTAVANASPPSDSASAPAPRVSTGVTPPRLLNMLSISYSNFPNQSSRPPATQVKVSYLVDALGMPRNIQMVSGINPMWDAAIVQAVSQLRYRPASIDHQSVPMEITLDINLVR